MAQTVLSQLGVALDLILPRLRRKIERRLVPELVRAPPGLRSVIVSVFAEAWLEGGRVGYLVHGSLLGAPETPNPESARAWRAAAMTHGEFVLSRFEAVLGDRGELTVESAGRWAKVAGESSVWRGVDEVGDDLARLEGVETKTWVRAWPRDDRRDWHDALNGVTIGIDELFTLPGGPNAGAQVPGPRAWDYVRDPGEHLSCGHALRFDTGAGETIYRPS